MNTGKPNNQRKNQKIEFGKHEIKPPAICSSVIGEDMDTMGRSLKKAIRSGADIIELRLDKLEDLSGWKKLLKNEVPTIITVRKKDEGGFFKGSEKDRIKILMEAIEKEVDCIDLAISTSKEKIEKVLSTAKKKKTETILSHHDFEKVPSVRNLNEKLEKMEKLDCSFAKIIGFANSYEDSINILRFLIQSNENYETPLISFAMGEKGSFTRFVSPILGSIITYGSVEEKAAPGQMNIRKLKEILSKFEN